MKFSSKKMLIIGAMASIGYGIFHYVFQPKVHQLKNRAVAVNVAVVELKDVEQTIQAIGTVQAYASVAVRPQVSGILANVSFEGGKDVQTDQELFQIDPRPFEIELQQAKADLAKAEAQYDNARSVYERYAKLIGKGFVSQDVYNEAKSNVSAWQATVAANQAAVRAAQLKLDYCTIRAPISGRTSNMVLHQGNLVKDNDPTPLVVINQIKPITVNFNVPEQFLPQIQQILAKNSIQVTALIGDNKSLRQHGQLTSLNNAIDTATGTLQLKATFANEDNLLWPGQFVTLSMPLAKYSQAMVVPSKAIEQDQQGSHVYVIDTKQVAHYQPVQTGISVDNQTVILQGVKPGDKVVVEGQFQLTPGKMVQINKAAAV